MSAPAILDTGPLVAALDRRDAYHGWVRDQLKGMRPPLLTCESVLSEATFLLAAAERAVVEIGRLLERRIVRVAFAMAQEPDPGAVLDLMHRYRNVPMSLADACLVRLSELNPQARIFTLDGDFAVYRRNRRQRIPLIHPEVAAAR